MSEVVYLWLPSEEFPWETCLRTWRSPESLRAYLESRRDVWRELLEQQARDIDNGWPDRNARWLPKMPRALAGRKEGT